MDRVYANATCSTTILFAAIAINPALQEKLNLFVAFCPVACVASLPHTVTSHAAKLAK